MRLPREPFRIVVCLLVVLVLSRFHQAVPALVRARPVFVLFAAALAIAVLKPSSVALKTLLRYWPARVMAALLLFACVSAPFGMSLGGSAWYILNYFARLVVIAFLVIAAIEKTDDLYLFVWGYVISTGLMVVFALFLFDLEAVGGGLMRLNDLFSYDSNDLGVLLATTVPLTALVWQAASRRWTKLLALCILVGTGVALARTGSRGGFVGLVVVGLAMVFLLRHVSVAKRLVFVAVTAIGVVVAAPQGYWDQMASLTTPTEGYNWDSYYGRRQLAERGVEYMLRYPVFGVGINNFRRADAQIPDEAILPGHQRYVAPHNSYIQIGSELGIPGLLLWSSLLVGGIVGINRLHRRLPKAWVRGDPRERFLYLASIYMPVALVGFAVTSFFLSFAYLQPVYLLAALTCGLYQSVERRLESSSRRLSASGGKARTARPAVGSAVRRPARSSPRQVGR